MRTGLTIGIYLVINVVAAQGNWSTLFNNQDLEGWEILGGEATYAVENDQIIGTTKGSHNTFLATKKSYSDFIFEVEVWVDPRMNSGIQFRSQQTEQGRVFGYQAEIDPSPRAYSGGIYDEGSSRDWLYPLSLNPAGQKAFVNGAWNRYRIEAIGTSIRIWVNDICTAVLEDDASREGFIALQVHGVAPTEQTRTVRWRNIRICTEDLSTQARPVPSSVFTLNLLPNNVSPLEDRLGWRLLWDGVTSSGWRQVHQQGFPDERWQIADGELAVQKLDKGGDSNGADLITEQRFQNFELTLQFKLSEGANSGIKYLVNEGLNPEGGAIGLEYQILDNNQHPDAKMGVGGNRTQASLYDLIPAENLSYAGMGKRFLRSIGEWNQVRIIVDKGHVEHWLNGFKVVEYDRRTPMFRALVTKSKYKGWSNFGRESSGHIVLQDHGDQVTFRSIKIREF